MYSLSQLRRGLTRRLRNRAYFGRELNRLYHRRLYAREWNVDGTDVFAEDWDSLILLDGCRYDTFARRHDLPGRLERRSSRGSHTIEFLRGNVADRHLADTVYVTASPQFYRHRDELGTRFHDVVDVWREHGWDEEHGTVLPETTTEAALAAAAEHPNKRLLVHYLQPHYPFIDADAGADAAFGDPGGEWQDVWNRLLAGDDDVDPARVRTTYRRNLDRALPAVEALMTELEGLTVVSSDHGNPLGERSSPVPIREWGHPPGVYTDELIGVPWLTHQRGQRREVVAGTVASAEPARGTGDETGRSGGPGTGDGTPADGTGEDAVDEATVEDRLEDLGYV
jgi:hypothetical protein